MTAPASLVEVQKLAHELGVKPESLSYLESVPASELATLRHGVSRAIFAANEKRIKPLGALAKRVPASLAARVAKAALGPLLCGRVASVMNPKVAIPLAGHFDAGFLAEVTLSLDPAASAEIIKGLDDELVIGVGEQLLEAGEYMVLARFITVVDEHVVLALVDIADGAQLLEVAVYAEDQDRIDELLTAIPEAKLSDVIEAAATDSARADSAVSLISMLSNDSQRKLADIAASLPGSVPDAIVGAIVRLEVWPELLPVVGSLSNDAIGAFVNVPTLLDASLVDELIVAVRSADDASVGRIPFRVLLEVLEVVDDAHLAMLNQLSQLDNRQTLTWAAKSTGTTEKQVREAIASLRAGEPLPEKFRAALTTS